ncbi:flagellar FlbD family protein [Hathewaya histolytica]|uniref:Flagellar FlbD family protein n=1 Tax=Hathewaya histolytica TaxID=1498 RepID=A0A4U9R882_HATHI|nr:flagellar FlbD family protein [Hathewaya histolytica]VTQ87725.1 flagellar FlbD family protein [Hathewaya histolytica]
MIELHGLNNKKFYLNEDNIEKMEEVPQTVITLINDKRYLVKESINEILKKIKDFKKNIYTGNIE